MMRIPLAVSAVWLFACGGGAPTSPATPSGPAAPAAPPASAAAPPAPATAADVAWSETGFAEQLQAAIHQRFPAATTTPLDEYAYRIALPPPGASVDVNFAKAHDSCRLDWASCQRAMDRTLQAVSDALQPPPITAAQLRVVLRANSKVAAYQAQGALITRPFSSDAQWLLVADLPTMIRFHVDLAALGMTDDQAWRTAIANMKKPPEALITTQAETAIIYQDVYAPSALLDPAGLEQAIHKQLPRRTGALLAVSPEDNLLIFTLGGHEDAARMQAVVAQMAPNARQPLSTQVMEWSNGAWRPAR